MLGLHVCVELDDFDKIIELAVNIANNGHRIAQLNYVWLHAYTHHKFTQDVARLP